MTLHNPVTPDIPSWKGYTPTRKTKFGRTSFAAAATVSTSDGPVIELTGTTYSLTLPSAVSNDGLWYHIVNLGTGIVTVDPAGSETIGFLATWALERGDFVRAYSNGANWIVLAASYRQRFKLYTAGSTHRFPQGCLSAVVTCQAGGGGSGGADTAGSSGGGGASGECRTAYVTPVPGTDYTVTVGAGGTAGADTGAGTGGTGGTSSLGALLSAAGGLGGAGNAAGGDGAGGAHTLVMTTATSFGTSSTGYNTPSSGGGTGTPGENLWPMTLGVLITSDFAVTAAGVGGGVGAGDGGGGGGGTLWGTGGAGAATTGAPGGSPSANTGAGAGGAYANNATNRAGAAGGSGFVLVVWDQ